jgi:hypothetical protein
MRKKLLLLLLLVAPVSAVINVTPASVGSSYIVWEWNTGLDLSDMYVDGNLMCGYETTDNNYAITGLNPNEQHNITVYTLTDTGGNITYTLNGTSGGTGGGGDNGMLAPGIVLGTAIGVIIFAGRNKT